MRVLGLVGKALILAPLAIWACSSGDPKGDEPVAKDMAPAVVWTGTSNTMLSARVDHAAVQLGDANGRVIVCGGRSAASTYVQTCDIYDPTTNAWSAGPSMPQQRAYQTVTALGANSVLLAGGFNGSGQPTAHPGSAASWGVAETINSRYQHTATRLSDGTVVVVGGQGATALTAQRRSGTTWSAAGTQDRSGHAAVLLSSGTDVLVTGGYAGSPAASLDTVSTYNAGSNTWTARASMTASGVSSKRRDHTATLLPDGTVLVVGGEEIGAAQPIATQAIRYNPTTNQWSDAGTIVAREEHAAILLNGYVIVVGGRTAGGAPMTSVQSYNPTTNTWTDLEALATPRSHATLTALPGGRLLAAGGLNGSTFLNTAEVLTPVVIGGTCTAPNAEDCISGRCVDNVCCDAACTGQCQACNEPSLAGTCSPVSGIPRGSRGNCANGYLCVTGSCALSCTSDAQCQSTYYCTTSGTPGVCALKKVQGDPCGGANQCGAGLFCTDGRCCNASCGGQCEHCDSSGACVVTAVLAAPVAPRAACGGTGAGTTCGASCSGVDTTPGRTSCAFPGSSLSCRAPSCSNGTAILASGCSGAGTCPNNTQPCGAYVCNPGGTACRTDCSTNTDCSATNFCDAGTCAPLRMKGQDCTLGTQCSSGNCVNQVCCDSPSCGAGSSCALAGHRGDCRKTIATGCSMDAECGSNQCADGVCCDVDCSGQCERCNAPGNVGSCVATLGAPVGTRSACGGTGAGTLCGQSCNGTNRTQCVYATSTLACRSASCSDGAAILVQHCNGAGDCPDSSTTCGAYTCLDTQSCRTSCTARAECAPGHLCDTTGGSPGTCVPIPGLGSDCQSGTECSTTYCVNSVCCGSQSCPTGSSCALAGFRGQCKKDIGTECTGNADCGSQRCVDGFCCNSDCNGQCESCKERGQLGTCVPVQGTPREPRAACQTGSNACGPRCDGTNADACTLPGQGASCGVRTCENGTETRVGTCNMGVCSGATRMCGAYACNADNTACRTDCTTADDCADTYFCTGGECVPNLDKGRDCDVNEACASGYCVDGVCCSSRSCPSGATCAFTGHHGDCTMDNGTECQDDSECGSGHCIDNYCCNSTCEGQCEACDVEGRLGACTPVSGEPHPNRPACDVGDGLCGELSCDGATNRDECVGYKNGTETDCAPAVCDGSDFTPPAVCSGSGTCRVPESTSCIPYLCEDTGCLVACDDNTSCAEGYHCANGECIASTATCSEDRSMSIPIDGPAETCTPYRCTTDGTCATSCQTSSECASGSACDTSTSPGQCKEVKAAAASDESGCGCAVPGRSAGFSGSLWLLALAAGASAVRRRAQRR